MSLSARVIPRLRRRALRWLIVSQALFVLSLIYWAPLFLGSLAIFSDGAAARELVAVVAIWLYPALSLSALGLAWLAFVRRRYGRAALWSAAPLAYAAALFALIATILQGRFPG